MALDLHFLLRRRPSGGRGPQSAGRMKCILSDHNLMLLTAAQAFLNLNTRLLLTLLSLLLAMVAYQLLHCCYRHFRYFNPFIYSKRYSGHHKHL